MALMFGVIAFMMLTMRSQKKREKKQREELYARLGKNDRVLTVGGVIGCVRSRPICQSPRPSRGPCHL